MNKSLVVLGLLLVAVPVEAGIISRTYTYTDGQTISANENNTNENTLYNEINGNLDTANIEAGGIENSDIADTQITVSKFASNVQSTFTYVNTFGTYRRPVLRYVSATTVDVENNTGTSNQTCIHFPDERRCVTEDTSSTSVNRRFIITDTASFSSTKNSGITPGETEATNTWYAVYAVKVTDNSTDFVLAASTNVPVQSRYSTLNALYGTNGWVYLGLIRNGDNSGATGDILNFRQSGNSTFFINESTAVASGFNQTGIRLASNASATSLTWTESTGTGATAIPENITLASFGASFNGGLNATTAKLLVRGTSIFTLGGMVVGGATTIQGVMVTGLIYSQYGLTATINVAGSGPDIFLRGYLDNALGVGLNPQI